MAVKTKITCASCNKTFYRDEYPSTKPTKNKFCSMKCIARYKHHGSNLACQECGSVFYRRFGEQRRAKTVFCSRSCYFRNRRNSAKATTYLKINSIHEHRIVAEKKIGRKLMKNEVVHHIDEDKHNNDPENLMIFNSQKEHATYHQRKTK